MNNKYSNSSQYYSAKKLGSFVENGNTYFRLFAPDAALVSLVAFSSLEDSIGIEHIMATDEDGVWETKLDGEKYGLYYGFKIKHKKHKNIGHLCIDPYSKAVATFNTYINPGRSIVIKEGNYDWEGDEWLQRDWRDLIIYEMHIRDMTAHPSSDRKSTRLNSSHLGISYAVFCLKKKKVHKCSRQKRSQIGSTKSVFVIKDTY